MDMLIDMAEIARQHEQYEQFDDRFINGHHRGETTKL